MNFQQKYDPINTYINWIDFLNFYTNQLIIREENASIKIFEENMHLQKLTKLVDALNRMDDNNQYYSDPIIQLNIVNYADMLLNGFTIK